MGWLDEHVQIWLDVAMRRVGIAELKNNLSRELRAVEAGEEVEVMDRARPVARLVPAPARTGAGRAPLQIQPAKRPFAEIRHIRYAPIGDGIDILELLAEERRDRFGR